MSRTLRMLTIVSAAVAVTLAAVHWSQSPPAGAVFADTDGDGTMDIAEEIASSDPDDASSRPEDLTMDLFFGSAACSDLTDNDGDGQIDAADSGCADADIDFISDMVETLLGSDPNDQTSFPESSRLDALFSFYGLGLVLCGDGIDNDRDGQTDATDSGCEQIQNDGDAYTDTTEKLFGSDPVDANSVPEHDMPNPGSCSDGIDNDLDGSIDAADEGCQPAPNDDFADATAIGSLPFNDSQKINSASRRGSDPYPSCSSIPPMNVWYSHTASADGVIAADVGGSNFDISLSVWRAEAGLLIEAGCASSFGFGPAGTPHVAFRAAAGETYYMMVGGSVGPETPANLSFHLTVGTPPANDDFENAVTISSLPFSVAMNTSDATKQDGEPSCSYPGAAATAWYRFQPSADTLVLADTTGSDFPAMVGVWTPSVFGLIPEACSFDNYSGRWSPKVAFTANAGETYFLQAGGTQYFGAGDLRLAIDVAVSPPNDDFSGATAVTSLPFDQRIDTLTATAALDEPSPSCTYGGRLRETIWYRYTADSDGFLAAGASAEDRYDLTVVAFEGTSLADLIEVSCGEVYPPDGRIGFRVAAGNTYYVLVGSRTFGGGRSAPAGGGGPFPDVDTEISVHIETLDVPPCPTPRFGFVDPTGDTGGFFGEPPEGEGPPDITSVTGGDDGENVCVKVQFAEPPEPPDAGEERASIILRFDAQEYPGRVLSCPGYEGADVTAYLTIPSNLFASMYSELPGGGSVTGYAIHDDSSLTLIFPISALGGDPYYRLVVHSSNSYGSDCAPDVGGIQSPSPPPPGDVNCDDVVNSVDSVLILQLFAGLIPVLPCQYAGDVNDNGGVGPIDALLILQYDSGMLMAFPAGAGPPGM